MLGLFAQVSAETAETLTWPIVLSAALADSINPCVFGVLIFLLAFMTKMYKKKSHMLSAGLLYTSVVYATYLVLGFGLIEVTVSLDISNAVYMVGAGLAIVAGLLELKDFFWYGKGLSLQMIPGAGERITAYTSKVEKMHKNHPGWSMAMIGLLGIFVVLVELPCTGAPYFAILALLAEEGSVAAMPYLLAYNLVFIAPLFVIIGLAYVGKGDGLEGWRKKHRAKMRLGTGLFLLALGAYMIYTVNAG
jgi:cytochrome c biogenesis protein CcdA